MKCILKISTTAMLTLACLTLPAHADPTNSEAVTFGGLFDTYSAHDFNSPDVTDRPYTTQALHDDQIDINLAMLESKLSTENYRGRLALQHGTSVESNYAAEEHLFWRYIQESSFGIKLSDKLWLDGGIYLSHIGFESFNSRDNWNYTRSFVAEFSPYYETGLKLSYQFDEDTSGQLHLLRGWQNISSEADPALGMQLTHALSKSTQITYNNFFGDVDGQRTFHDFITKTDVTENLSLALQADVGSQEQDEETVWWHGFSLMSRYKINPKLFIGGRVERFSDPHQVVLTSLSGPSVNTTGLSANIDYEVYPHIFWRNEYRTFFATDPVFPRDSHFSKDESFVVTSLSFSF